MGGCAKSRPGAVRRRRLRPRAAPGGRWGSWRQFSLTVMPVLSDNSVMTETAEIYSSTTMPVASREFVLRWGEMGDRWGLNRSVAQVHALLYLAERPLTAEDIAGQLAMARSNV